MLGYLKQILLKNKNLIFSFLRTQTLFVLVLMQFFYACKTSKKPLVKTTSESVKGTDLNKLNGKEKVEFDTYFFDANKEKILGNYEPAVELFLKALKVNSNSSAVMYELANIYLFHKNYRAALHYSKKASIIEPQNKWYQLLYIDCLSQNKQYSELVKEYKKIIKQYPENLDYVYELANVYLSLNMAKDALKMYDDIEAKKGVTEEISMQKIRIYRALNDVDKSILEVNKLIEKFPTEAKYYGFLGELYQLKGQNDKALEVYKTVLILNPEDPFAHLTMADYYRSQKQYDKAFEEIKIAFNSQQLDIDTKIKMLLSYYTMTETAEEYKSDALELCKIVINVHPKEAKSYSMYGDFLYRDKSFEEAKVQYKKAIELDKDKYAIWNQLLIIESELNDYAALEVDSRDAIELFPNQTFPYYLNGVANIKLKKLNAAIESFNAGKELVFDNDLLLAQFYANIGDVQNQLKNYSASDSAYDASLKYNPNNVYVLNNYAYYLSLRKINLEKAEKMSKKSNEISPNNSSFQDTYGWILFQMKKYEDAKIWIAKAIENSKAENGTLLEHYGDILFQLNDIDNALKYWINANKIGGTSELIDKKIVDKKWYD